MITKVKLVQLHEPLFLSGTNWGSKLTPHCSKGILNLTHDSESDHVIVEYKGERAHIKNWASFNEDIPTKPTAAYVPTTVTPFPSGVKAQATGPEKTIRTAQVETPQSKVQGKPGRKAKYQGEESQGE